MMLDQKQIQVVFLFEFKMGYKAAEITCKTSATYLAQELLTNVQCRGGLRSFAKEMRALKMRSAVARHQKLTMTNYRIFEADPLKTAQEVAKEFNIIWLFST